MARIKTMTYERLFSLTNYNNEKVSFTAELSEGENSDVVLGQLFHKVTDVHNFFAYYRTVLSCIDNSRGRITEYRHRIAITMQQIETQKITIAELTEKLKTGDLNDERIRHACAGTSLKEMNAGLESEKKTLLEEEKRHKELEDFLEALQDRVRNGNLTLLGIDCPHMRLDTQDDE